MSVHKYRGAQSMGDQAKPRLESGFFARGEGLIREKSQSLSDFAREILAISNGSRAFLWLQGPSFSKPAIIGLGSDGKMHRSLAEKLREPLSEVAETGWYRPNFPGIDSRLAIYPVHTPIMRYGAFAIENAQLDSLTDRALRSFACEMALIWERVDRRTQLAELAQEIAPPSGIRKISTSLAPNSIRLRKISA